MTKRELIDEILCLNLSAEAEFLARFEREDLEAYLGKLREAARAETRSVCRTRRSPGLLEARQADDPRSGPGSRRESAPDRPANATGGSPACRTTDPAHTASESSRSQAGACRSVPETSWETRWDDGEPDLPLFESAASRGAS
jgi:hypothetical protein